tara:strand:- start:73466 stop:74251 length:786 start_codon:yes stop_codon:yes gene_type:complete
MWNIQSKIIIVSGLISFSLLGTTDLQGGSMVDHSLYNKLLNKYVNNKGLVNYRAWKNQDVNTLDTYLDMIKEVDTSKLEVKNELLAFWINTYNALTIRGILHFYPTNSIKNHVSVVGYSIWKDYKININDNDYSLDDIEHKILRNMDEPLIHFALVCASIGCPPLLKEAFRADNLEEQLADNARVFFLDPTKFDADSENNIIKLSPILDWYKDDFGNDQRERLNFIIPYIPDNIARNLLQDSDVTVEYLDYNWGINEQKNY